MLKLHDSALVDLVEFDIRTLHLAIGILQGLPFQVGFAGLVNDGVSFVLGSQSIVTQSAIGIAFQFGNVAEIVECERVVRVEKIRFVEEALGLFLVAVLELGNAFAVEPLRGSGDAALRNGDAQVARRNGGCASQQLEGKAGRNRDVDAGLN